MSGYSWHSFVVFCGAASKVEIATAIKVAPELREAEEIWPNIMCEH